MARRSGVLLWWAWVVAAVIGFELPLFVALRGFGLLFGAAPGSIAYRLITLIVGAVGLALLQVVVLRVLVTDSTVVAVLWLPAGLAVALPSYAITQTWLAVAPTGSRQIVAVLLQVAFTTALGLLQGTVLNVGLHRRSALVIWPLANLLILAIDYASVGLGVPMRLVHTLPLLQALVLVSGISGLIYGAVTGAALVALARGVCPTP